MARWKTIPKEKIPKRYQGKGLLKPQKTQYDGIWFDSKAEFHHYLVLKDEQRRGRIHSLVVHPEIVLGDLGTWKPDFRYFDIKLDQWVINEVKGCPDELYRLRIKLLKKYHPQYVFKETPASIYVRRTNSRRR